VLEVVVSVDQVLFKFEAAPQCERVFGFVEFNLRLEPEQVTQNGRPWPAVRIDEVSQRRICVSAVAGSARW